ncbi:SDR family NAD(P)-dependent oxidoreductase [Mycobacterium szulgai]|nr:SDR family NAD(P)-dependent oxidoreductase [Mycobacterium szulgai]MCV7079674.1 SDR family NAD(P)-dependent oxidoreductase [Mycobacterium szulgai]
MIAGSAVNQDGASNGLTAPNGPAQQRVIIQAAANAGIGLDEVDVVEAHGTGTTLGDPIEAGALLATYGAGRDPEHPLWLGSVKSNIGHTQAAAGAAGLIKMITALNQGVLPPTLHVDQPSPHIDWSAGTVQLLTEALPWPATEHPRTAGVSSFGISGTNAHLIVQQAPSSPPADPAPTPKGPSPLRFWPLSARTPAALQAAGARLHQHLLDHPDVDLTDLAYSLATTRTHHAHRAAITVAAAAARDELLDCLHALALDQPHPGVRGHHYQAHQPNKTVFVFPGQGAQYPQMAAALYAGHRGFAEALDEVCAAFDPHLDVALAQVMFAAPDTAEAELLNQTAYAQPALFAVGVALSAVLTQAGIHPDYLVGHSVGELAAAHVAGMLSLADAAVLVSARGRLMQACAPGAMLAIAARPADLAAVLADDPQVELAAVNGPTALVVSGPADHVHRLDQQCAAAGYKTTPLRVSHAFHSASMDPALPEFHTIAAALTWAAPSTAIISTLTGQPATPDQLTSPDYWTRQLREPVRFHDTITTLLTQGPHTFIELSPHPVLAPALTDTVETTDASTVIPTLVRDQPDLDTLAGALAQLHTHGHSPSWTSLYPGAHTIALPTYPFQHRSYWLTPVAAGDVGAAGLDKPDHPLLGALTELADQDQIVLTGRLSTVTHPWLAGHRVDDTVVFPGTGYIELLLQAGEYAQCPVIDELVLHTPLTLEAHTPTDVQITVQAEDDTGRRPFTVHSRTGGTHGPAAWSLHASGALSTTTAVVAGPLSGPWNVDPIDTDSFYRDLADHGLHYHSPFQSVRGIGRHPSAPDTVSAEVVLPADTDISGYGIHPALLDAALHPLAAAFYDTDPSSDTPTPRLPFAFTGVTLHAIGATRLHVQLSATAADTFTLHATDPAGAPVVTIDTLTLRARPDHINSPAPAALRDSLFELHWPALAADTFALPASAPVWAVLTDAPDRLPASLQTSPTHHELANIDLAHTDVVIWPLPDPAEADPLQRVHTLTRATISGLQNWLTHPDTLHTPLVILTSHAVSTTVYDHPPDLAHAAVWALIHTTQNEHPDRITALDIDTTTATDHTLVNVLAALADPARRPTIEPQLALRHGNAHTPRLTPSLALTPPSTPSWQLHTTGKGINSLALIPTEPATVLAPGQIRVAIRAAGLTFRDAQAALGTTADTRIGREGAGVVLDTAPDVTTLTAGDAVMGLFPHNAFAPTALTDHRLVTKIPTGWSFAEAASVPVAFVTAYTALVDHAHLNAGQRVLIHAATGAIGQAAIQIAQHLGAEIFATAHPHKHHVLTDLGIPTHHLASSRTPDFADTFTHATNGHGIDVILNSLTEFSDASRQLLHPSGHFRRPHRHPTYDLTTTPPDHIQRTWHALTDLFTTATLHPLPTTSYGLTQAPHAFTDISQARHTGKIVLTPPTVLTPDGTVLITGGTGMLGQLFAEHLITHHGARHLLLASRSGPHAPGATELHHHLTNLGAHVTITACDTSNPTELTTLLANIPTQHPLTAIIHTAGALHDALTTDITPDQLHTVLTAKADTAWHLHQLTTTTNLDTFILFSSVAATLGAPGQGAYAAANAVLDALAQQRHRHHHPTTSLAWGYWQTPSGMTAHLTHLDHTRMTRNGLTPIPTDQGLTLFDTALTHHQPHLIPTPLNKRTLTPPRPPKPPCPQSFPPSPPPAAKPRHHHPNTLATQLAATPPNSN